MFLNGADPSEYVGDRGTMRTKRNIYVTLPIHSREEARDNMNSPGAAVACLTAANYIHALLGHDPCRRDVAAAVNNGRGRKVSYFISRKSSSLRLIVRETCIVYESSCCQLLRFSPSDRTLVVQDQMT